MVVSHHPRALKCEAAEAKLATASQLNPEAYGTRVDVAIKSKFSQLFNEQHHMLLFYLFLLYNSTKSSKNTFTEQI